MQELFSVKTCIVVAVVTGILGLGLVRLLPPPPPDAGLPERLETFRESNAFLGKE
jgi:hypothetical protein